MIAQRFLFPEEYFLSTILKSWPPKSQIILDSIIYKELVHTSDEPLLLKMPKDKQRDNQQSFHPQLLSK